MVLESVVKHYIQEISDDPKRGIRKLVDLGQQNTRGGFRASFLRFSRDLLRDEESPYYILVQNAAERIDSQILQRICINFGYNSWTKGAGLLRQTRQEKGAVLPWNITIHLDEDMTGHRGLQWCRDLIAAGEEQGIYSYSLFTGHGFRSWEALYGLLASVPDCGIFLFLPAQDAGWEREALLRLRNTVLLVDFASDSWAEQLGRFCESGCMCGLYRRYRSPADGAEIVSGRWLEQTAGYAIPCAIALAAPDAPEELCGQVREYVLQARENPKTPTVLVDYYSDFASISEVIVGRPAFLGIGADGRVTTSDGWRELPADKQFDFAQSRTLLMQGV